MYLPNRASRKSGNVTIGTTIDMTGTYSIDQAEIRFLIEKNADGIIVVDELGIVLFANPAAEEVFGRPSESLTGSPIGIPSVVGDMTEIAIHRPGRDQIDAEIRVVETTWDHRPARLVSIRDVSGRRAMEERLRHAAKMEAVGRLTAGIAHDFNNHLTVVLGNLESAKRRSLTVDQSLMNALDNATKGAKKAAALTERLLAFARRKPLEPRLLNPRDLVSSMSDLLQRTLGERIKIQVKAGDPAWAIEADPTELEAAILNLAVNARDAMPTGGDLLFDVGNVQFSDADRAAAANEIDNGPYVLISVSDSGMGMTPEILDHVFEPFFTTKTDGRGTGLGLSQVYGFVKQSGGHVRLSSEPNAGTTVEIFLPAVNTPNSLVSHIVPDTPRQVPVASPAETILVVEDDADVRHYTVSSLLELGYRVHEAADAGAALEILDREPGTLLLFTDLGLPGEIDGKNLAERARLSRPTLKVLITTAYAGDVLVHEGRLDPGVALLNKPFSREALAMRIREVLDSKPSGNALGARVLVVEDEFLLQLFVTDMLAEWGITAEVAANFKDAVAKIRNGRNDLVGAIIDLGLPDRPGNELIGEIRALYPEMPIVLATGYADDRIRERTANMTGVQILTKPFQARDLRTLFHEMGVPLSGRE
jgi:signal transduction histidine kinase/CheY-like chemotaxis protein